MLKSLTAQLLAQQAALVALAADQQSPNCAHAAALGEPVTALLRELRNTTEGSPKARLIALTVPAVTLTIEKLLAQDAARKANNPVAALMAGIEAGQAAEALGSMADAMAGAVASMPQQPQPQQANDLPSNESTLAILRQQQVQLQTLADSQAEPKSSLARRALPLLQEFIAAKEGALALPAAQRAISDLTLRRHAQRMIEMNTKFLALPNPGEPAPKAEHPEIIQDLLKAFPGATVQLVEGKAAKDLLATLQSGESLISQGFSALGALRVEGIDSTDLKAAKKAAKAERKAERKAAQQASMSTEALAEREALKAFKALRAADEAEHYASLSKREKAEHHAIRLLAKAAARNSPLEWREIANLILKTLDDTQMQSDE